MSESNQLSTTIQPQQQETTKPPKKPRCMFEGCKRKLGIIQFSCRCEKVFCEQHRGYDLHDCTFDYKAEGKKELLKYMSSPVISSKVAVI